MTLELFDYSPITERPQLTWPGGKRVAFYVGLNVEAFLPDRPSTSIWPLDLVPDALNHGWRDYGARVGIWRTIDILDKHGVRASTLLNSMVAEQSRRSSRPAWNAAGPGWRTGRRTRSCTPVWSGRRSVRS